MPSSDFLLVLSQDNGSLPPQHRRTTRVTLDADGLLRVTRKAGYRGDGETTERTLNSDTIRSLAAELRTLGLFSTLWEAPEQTRVGGRARRLTVTAGGESADIPAIVRKEQTEARDRIFACLWEMLDLDGVRQPEPPESPNERS